MSKNAMDGNVIFRDRHDAGMRLADELLEYKQDPNAIILALPRGGVPVAYEIAKKLKLPLDVFIVRKLGVPNQKELAMGSIASGDIIFFNHDVIANANISKRELDQVVTEEKMELRRRELLYRQAKPFPDLKNKTIILVDDGIATGASIHSAIIAIKKLNPKKMIVAIPVAPASTMNALSSLVDQVTCFYPAQVFFGVGSFYEDFLQTSDDEVNDCLKEICSIYL